MGIRADLLAYDATVNTNVTVKVAVNSIDPVDVGNIGTDLSATIVDVLERSNQETITSGTAAPLDASGADGDRYFQNTGSVTYEWRKTGGTWVNNATISLGVTFPDGPLTNLRTSISAMIVTVTAGSWAISNVIYQKATQTQFTLSASDLNFTRYDLIYANSSNQVLILTGIAASTPVVPTLPANSVQVDVAVIPSSSSGVAAYLQSGAVSGSANIVTVTGTTDASGNFDASALGTARLISVYEGDVLTRPEYNKSTKLLSAMNPSTAITAYFL